MISSTQTSHLDPIGSFLAMEIFSRALELQNEGRDIIHMEFGEPDFSAPPDAAKTVRKSMELNAAGYTHTQGIEELRNEIVKKYAQDYSVQILPEQVLVSNGSSILLYFASLLDHFGDFLDPVWSLFVKTAIFTGTYVFQCFLMIFAFKMGAKTT